MNAVYSIAAELNGVNGAPWWLKHHGYLPERYISKIDARKAGWDQRTGNLGDILCGKVIGGDVYQNRNGHLPSAYGRTWFEADLHYSGGFRSSERVLYSSDGLVFVTYDHYHTFVEVI